MVSARLAVVMEGTTMDACLHCGRVTADVCAVCLQARVARLNEQIEALVWEVHYLRLANGLGVERVRFAPLASAHSEAVWYRAEAACLIKEASLDEHV